MQGAFQRIQQRTQTPDSSEAATESEMARLRNECVWRVAEDLGPRYSPKRASLGSYRQDTSLQQKVVARLAAFCATISERVKEGAGLVLYGSVGTGKDHLMAAVLYAAAKQGHSCRWVNGQEVFGDFRDRIDTKRRDEESFRELCAPSVLAISDPLPPTGSLGNWDIANLYRILDRRYRSLRCTWVTINVATVDEANAQLSAPVFDRIREQAELVPCFWPSFRKGG